MRFFYKLLPASERLTREVAHNYHRLLADKDKWEVARVYSEPEFIAQLNEQLEPGYRLHFHMGAWHLQNEIR